MNSQEHQSKYFVKIIIRLGTCVAKEEQTLRELKEKYLILQDRADDVQDIMKNIFHT
jgi:hypothetical protein